MLGGLFKLWLFTLFVAILDSTGHAGWQYGKTVKLAKIQNPTITISSNTTIQSVSSARNLGIIFYSNLSFSVIISRSYISKSQLLLSYP